MREREMISLCYVCVSYKLLPGKKSCGMKLNVQICLNLGFSTKHHASCENVSATDTHGHCSYNCIGNKIYLFDIFNNTHIFAFI